MSLDRRNAGKEGAEFPDAMQNFYRYRKALLNLDNKKSLSHGVTLFLHVICQAASVPDFLK
jgi:hypothetical protein